MKIILVAVPGAGKTSVMQLVKKQIPKIKLVNFGDFMFDLAKKSYGIKDRDLMRKQLSLKEYREIQLKAANEISKIKGDLILDTHAAIKTPQGFYPGLPKDIVTRIHPDVIVLMEFDPKVILKRRQKDIGFKGVKKTEIEGVVRTGRSIRDIESVESIEEHQEISKLFACISAVKSKSKIRILNLRWKEKSEFEHAVYAAKEIAKIFKEE
jgi:adenylate kinase